MVQILSTSFREACYKGNKLAYHGNRAGITLKEQEAYRHYHIEAITPGSVNPDRKVFIRNVVQHNSANCVLVARQSSLPSASSTIFIPAFLLSNVISLSPKMD